MQISKKIRKIRELKGFSQEYMASQLKMTQTNYSKIERGESKEITLTRLEDIAKLLEVSINDLLNFDEKRVFNSTFNNHTGNQGDNIVWMNQSFERERDQYEARIKHLEEEISFLREMLRKNNH